MKKMDFKVLQIPVPTLATNFELVLIGDVYMVKKYDDYLNLLQSITKFLKESQINSNDEYGTYLFERHSMYQNLNKATSKKKASTIARCVNDMLNNSPAKRSMRSPAIDYNGKISTRYRSPGEDRSIEVSTKKSLLRHRTEVTNVLSDQKYSSNQIPKKIDCYSEIAFRNNFLDKSSVGRINSLRKKLGSNKKKENRGISKSPMAMSHSSRDPSEYLMCTLTQKKETPTKHIVRNLDSESKPQLDSESSRNQVVSTFKQHTGSAFKNARISSSNLIDNNLRNIKNMKNNISPIDQDYLQALKEVMEDYEHEKIATTKRESDIMYQQSLDKSRSLNFTSFLCSTSILIDMPESNDDKYFFSVDLLGNLRQYCMKTEELIHDYFFIVHPQNEFHDCQNKRVLDVSFNENYMFVCDPYCNLIMIDIKNRKVIHKFPDVFESSQFMIICTKNAED